MNDGYKYIISPAYTQPDYDQYYYEKEYFITRYHLKVINKNGKKIVSQFGETVRP